MLFLPRWVVVDGAQHDDAARLTPRMSAGGAKAPRADTTQPPLCAPASACAPWPTFLTASVYIAISVPTASPVLAGTTPKLSTIRLASIVARRNSSSLGSAAHCV